MAFKFSIRNTAPKAEKEGDTIVRYSGTSEPFRRISERSSTPLGYETDGSTKVMFTTGLDDSKVEFFKWYSKEEKEIVKKSIEDLRTGILNFYGGPQVLDPQNKFFWKKNVDVGRLSLDNETIDTFYDTAHPPHALLYLSVVSGAFMDLVAPTKEWAIRNQIPHYLALEEEVNTSDDEGEVTRSEAHAALTRLKKESPEALFILAWCLQYDTNGYGAYNKATSPRDLITYHIKYIEGKLVTKKKRDCAKTFIEYVEKWEGQQTRPRLYTEAYVKAGDYFSFIQQKEKKYTMDGSILGNTVEEAVENLHKSKFRQDYEKLRDLVEAKWSE